MYVKHTCKHWQQHVACQCQSQLPCLVLNWLCTQPLSETHFIIDTLAETILFSVKQAVFHTDTHAHTAHIRLTHTHTHTTVTLWHTTHTRYTHARARTHTHTHTHIQALTHWHTDRLTHTLNWNNPPYGKSALAWGGAQRPCLVWPVSLCNPTSQSEPLPGPGWAWHRQWAGVDQTI